MTDTDTKQGQNGTATEAKANKQAPQQQQSQNTPTADTPKLERTKSSATVDSTSSPPRKKRRKVNHACVYCRRSHMTCDLERPCARCVKRDIAHLCHDEPREATKPKKPDTDTPPADTSIIEDERRSSVRTEAPTIAPPKPMSPAQMKQPQPQAQTQRPFSMNDWNFGSTSNQLHDMRNLHPNYTFNTSEVTDEYNFLGDFLNNSLLDDTATYNPDDSSTIFNDPLLATGSLSTYANNMNLFSGIQQAANPSSTTAALPPSQQQQQQQQQQQLNAGNEISRPSSVVPGVDTKARDKFYMTAADPAGNDTPEARMLKLLQAKYDAGMLRPFNYVRGYSRLNTYMESHMRPVLRQKILKQLEKFRPKFREAMHNLTDIQLIRVEMWWESTLMEYDRVFASMAIPACCWRRTGEIFRGNKEMAELIQVPMEELRDGKLALHEIMAEDSLVSYWEKFGAIAFDQSQKAILTSCTLKHPTDDVATKDASTAADSKASKSGNKEVGKGKVGLRKCCFSFTIRRDIHNM
ncbi:hypothetical protein AUEXF2481DRAFT_349637 [Aureobasidium subglaciale EXF-2481]|uniref:Zn(2)-C6 fungal-type domain-containing protein n=1 Tax=Aureobasidium subglaciale (strain EXF-2481) TaxID=1043005 RepID=A0A074Z1Y5_AURSE|nr:uncharacterized protein AUEXF2481DRAFT_349637 [Aureobasidium subglaciale EXF-2481]KAI5206873.1 hypothetical protein E4T38_03641 [Aureobasidium subglaciale]KAI5225607.1 hypothetical protein E4T40_03416 [Aureobasidium subglaciale]KAI5229122.1 hypothetical protein E4T41_03520 [Aureobasidium subglaciale]KAI5263850.1 hypothetical protein E4T46_03415 [Aureobasidium subglaciale]KEQ93071.1 hypothetical protein AUEXF2481DRAFT_349637 [Aureobasidium subglaciale EXF-2481]